jgi:Tol biopolymer transport system component
MWLGSYDLSPDGRKLAIQTGGIGGIRLWQVDLVSGNWERWIDAASGLDAVPLTGLKWTPDAKYVYALTEVYPAGTSELVRLSATTDESEILSASTDISIVPWLDIASDGARLAHGQGDARLVFRDPSGKIIESLPTAGPTIGRPVLSPDGRFVAFMTLGSEARSIEIMRLSDGSRWPLQIQEDFELWPVDWF